MTRVLLRPWTMLAAALLLAAWACPALAHRVNVFAYVEGGDVVAECSYSRSSRVRFGEISVENKATGAVYLTGKTDEQGAFRFSVPPAAREAKADLRIVLRAGEGHQNDTIVTAAEYLATLPAKSAAPAGAAGAASFASADSGPASQTPAAPAAASGTAAVTPGAGSASGPTPGGQTAAPLAGAPAPAQNAPRVVAMDPTDLSALVEAAVEKKIAPLRAILVGEKERGPGLTEIIGGIGWLAGLAGLAAYVRGRRGRPHA